MALTWKIQPNPVWDDDKERVVGGAPPGALDISYRLGTPVPGDWWVAEDESGAIVGFGWLDATWGGDAEILLAVNPSSQQSGVGTFILGQLEREAAKRGMNYVYNTVRETHPGREVVHDWLAVRGYWGSSSDTTLRKRVSLEDDTAPAPPQAAGADAAKQPGPVGRPPGHEESGGYVDVDEHRY